MHICYLCNEYPPARHGGVGSFTQTIARALVERGHDITAVGIYRRADVVREVDRGVQVVRLPNTPLRGSGFFVNGRRLRRELDRVAARRRIDLLEGPEASLAALRSADRPRTVIRMNGGHHFFSASLGEPARRWRSWLELRSFRRADHLCAVSRHVANETRRLLSLGERPVEILPNVVDTEQFRPRPEIKEEDGLITFVGTVCRKKGIAELLGALPRIVSAVPGAHLVILGRDTRDPETGGSYTRALLKRVPSGIRDRVCFAGAVTHDDLPRALAAAQLCAYPSYMEAMPVAWLEGMAMGKAVLASSSGPGPEVIEHGESGWLCDPHDPDAIADGAIRLLCDPSLRERLGAAARNRVVERFSVDAVVARTEAFYQRCAEGG